MFEHVLVKFFLGLGDPSIAKQAYERGIRLVELRLLRSSSQKEIKERMVADYTRNNSLPGPCKPKSPHILLSHPPAVLVGRLGRHRIPEEIRIVRPETRDGAVHRSQQVPRVLFVWSNGRSDRGDAI